MKINSKWCSVFGIRWQVFSLLLITFYLIPLTAHAQQPERLKPNYIEMRLIGDPASVAQKGVLWYDNTDSLLKIRNPNGTITVLQAPSSGYYSPWDTAAGVVVLVDPSNTVEAGAGSSTTQILFNNAGIIQGDAGMIYNLTTNKITVDSIQARYRIAAGSSTTQVLFNLANVIVGDAGMVYNSTTNKLTVDTVQTIWRPSAGSAITQVLFNNGLIAAGDAGMIYNSTTNKLTVDTVQAVVRVVSGVVAGAALNQFAAFTPIAEPQAISGPGAVNLTTYLTNITTTGADAFTLANGTIKGQRKKITLAVDGGDATLTLTGYTSIVFDNAGENVLVAWSGTAWVYLENSGTTITP